MDSDAAAENDDGLKVWSKELRALLDEPDRNRMGRGKGLAWEDGDVTAASVDRRLKRSKEEMSVRLPPRRDDTDVGTPEGDKRAAELWRKIGTPDRELEEAMLGARSRYTVDRTAAIDQISGKAFSTVRQSQLRELPGAGHLATGYGLKAAGQPDMSGHKITPGIRIRQDLTTPYMREQLPGAEASPFPALYKLRTGRAPGQQVRYLNSKLAYEKMRKLKPANMVLPNETALLGLPDDDAAVCWAIELPAMDDEQRGAIDELMHTSGATPSTHAALQKLGGLAGTNPAPIADRVPTLAPRGASFDSGPGKKLAALPETHPAKATAESARRLLTGLTISAEAAADPLVVNALANLDKLVQAMAGCVDQAGRLNQLYELFMEEIYLVTGRARPYTPDDYRAGATASLKERAPALKAGLSPEVEIKPFLVASGMDALSTALVGAMAERAVDSKVDRADGDNTYFENISLLDHSTAVQGADGPIMVATLNGSTPAHGDKRIDEVGGLIEKIEQKLAAFPAQLVTLILDVTIEVGAPGGETDLNLVFDNAEVKRALNAGLLGITLCKSYQKYATMGTGKLMAGNVTLVGKPAASAATATRLAQSETERGAAGSDELQLMTHLVTQGGKDELAMLDHAAANARTVHAASWPAPKPGEGFQDGLPFLMAPVQVSVKGKLIDTTEIGARMGLDKRESFSFQQSSCLLAGSSVRINTGQESEAGAMEKLHALGLAMKGPIDDKALSGSINTDLKGIASSVDRFAISKTASKLLLSTRVIAPENSTERQALQAQLRQLLALDDKAGPAVERLTPETRAALQVECLRLALDNPPGYAVERNDKEILARQAAVGESLRRSYEESGSNGGWQTRGGRKIVMALSEFEKRQDDKTAQALAKECQDWLNGHGPKDSARPEVEALLRKARTSAQRTAPDSGVRELIAALRAAEDVGRFLLEDVSEALVDSSEGGAIVDACLKRLDLSSSIALLAIVAGRNSPKLEAALAERLGEVLAADEPPPALSPETLADTPEDTAAPQMSGAAFEQARQAYVAARHKGWPALLGWLEAKGYESEPWVDRRNGRTYKAEPWVHRLQALAKGFEAKAAEIARIALLPGRQRALAAAAAVDPALAPALATPYAEALKLKVDALVGEEEAGQLAARAAESKRIAAEQLARSLAEYEAMSVPTLIDACPDDAGGHAARFKAFHVQLEAALANVAGTGADVWKDIQGEWEKVSNLVQNLDDKTPEALARQQLLKRRFSDLQAQAAATPEFQAATAAQDTVWLGLLVKAVGELGVMAKARIKLEMRDLKEGPELDAAARLVRAKLLKDLRTPEQGIAKDNTLWPPD